MQFHLVGGFLGSGKTTAIIQAARSLVSQGSALASSPTIKANTW